MCIFHSHPRGVRGRNENEPLRARFRCRSGEKDYNVEDQPERELVNQKYVAWICPRMSLILPRASNDCQKAYGDMGITFLKVG